MENISRKGFLLVLMQPPPAFEEEFNDWYDTEHVPERLAVPGFRTGLRYVGLSGTPKYMAMYDLDSFDVLDSPAYHAVSGANFSPWTRRVTSRVRVIRTAGEQIYPGDRITGPSSRVLLLRFRGLGRDDASGVVDAVRRTFEPRPETRQARVLAFDTGSAIDYFGFIEASIPSHAELHLGQLGTAAHALDMVNSYAPYHSAR